MITLQFQFKNWGRIMQENEIYTSLIKNISSFPAISSIVGEVCSICQDPNSSIADLTKVIERDPGIIIDILRISNSPIYGFTREILNISQAVSLFGMGTIKGFVISSVIRKNMKISLESYATSTTTYLDICREYNRLLMEVYKGAPNEIKEVIFPASFLMTSGIMLLAGEAAKLENIEEFQAKIKESDYFLDVENEFFGVNCVDVTALLFEHWNFESALIEAIRGVSKDELTETSAPLKFALNCIGLHKQYTPTQLENARKFIADNALDLDATAFEAFVNAHNENSEVTK